MDFITSLPDTERGFDSVFVVVDRLTKRVRYIPTTKDVSALKVADLFIDNVFKIHGLPETIVSDRDGRFMSQFWTGLMQKLKVGLTPSSAFHPQTDGQTERANRTLTQALRSFVEPMAKDWDLYLPMLEFAHNSVANETTKESPFFLNYGYHPRGPLDLVITKVAQGSTPTFVGGEEVNNVSSTLGTNFALLPDLGPSKMEQSVAAMTTRRQSARRGTTTSSISHEEPSTTVPKSKKPSRKPKGIGTPLARIDEEGSYRGSCRCSCRTPGINGKPDRNPGVFLR